MQPNDPFQDGTPPPLRPWLSPKIEAFVAATCMIAMTVIVFANVLVRYFTSASLAFSEEFAINLMVAMTFFGASAAAAGNHHIRITFVMDRMPSTWRRRVGTIIELISVATFMWLAWLCGLQTLDTWEFQDVSPAMGIPMWLYWICLPILCLSIALRILQRWWRDFRFSKEGSDVA